MIHQPLGGSEGQATDVEIFANELLNVRDTLNRLLAKHTGQTVARLAKDTDRNNFMSAEEAKKYGGRSVEDAFARPHLELRMQRLLFRQFEQPCSHGSEDR